MRQKTKGIVAITASAFGFALMAVFVRLCDDFGAPISSFQKGFFRNAVALAVAVVAFLRAQEPKAAGGRLSGRGWLLLLGRSFFGTVGIFANFYALSHIPIAEGMTLNKTAPFFTVAVAWLFLGEKASRWQLLALVLAFCGVVLVAKPGFAGEEALPLSMGLLGGACAGLAYACVRSLRNHAVSPAFIILFFSAVSCLASLPFMIVGFDPMTWRQVLILVGAGVGAAIGQFGITLAYGYAAPREIAVFDYTNILFSAVFGYVLFGQLPDVLSALGFVAILAAATLSRRGL